MTSQLILQIIMMAAIMLLALPGTQLLFSSRNFKTGKKSVVEKNYPVKIKKNRPLRRNIAKLKAGDIKKVFGRNKVKPSLLSFFEM